ncbi:hypothetical protein B0H13DRAFT_2031491 [Mycena leptocephala]|nr:hypothetical protein B0H13DRAFT_2031491 [Mycena leptocephala]
MSFFTSLFDHGRSAPLIELTTTEDVAPFTGSRANPRHQRYKVIVPKHEVRRPIPIRGVNMYLISAISSFQHCLNGILISESTSSISRIHSRAQEESQSYQSNQGRHQTHQQRDETPRASSHPPSMRHGRSTEASDTVVGFKTAIEFLHSSNESFQYHTSTSTHDIEKPPASLAVNSKAGDIYLHINTRGLQQVWMYNGRTRGSWEDISDIWQQRRLLVHPTLPDQVLSFRDDGTPDWILRTSVA